MLFTGIALVGDSHLLQIRADAYCFLLVGTWNKICLGSDNGLLPGGTKPLPEPVLTSDKWCYVEFIKSKFTAMTKATVLDNYLKFLAATKQLYECFSPSVRPSVCLSVRHTFLIMFPSSYHHDIFRSYYQWQKWCPCKRSRSKVEVTEVTTQFNRFRTVTPVWIHIWWWNDIYIYI